jgi:hypothetical protein
MWFVPCVAVAAEPWTAAPREPLAEEWSDGLTQRPVRTPAVALSGVSVVNAELSPSFGDVSLQYGAAVEANAYVGISVDARVVSIDTVEGATTGLQTAGAQGWVVLDLDNVRHGLGLAWVEPTGLARGWYLYHPLEGGRRVVGTYDAYVDLGRFDLALDTRLGFGQGFGVQLTGTVAGVVELDRHVAVTAGVQGGLAPTATALIGALVRPVPQLEVGVSLGVPVAVFVDTPTGELQPGLRAKAWF